MDHAIVVATSGNWTPNEGTVRNKALCSMTLELNGQPTSAYFYEVEATPATFSQLVGDHRILGTIPLGSAQGAEGRASRASAPV